MTAWDCTWRGWVYHGNGRWYHQQWGWFQDDGSWGSDYYCGDSNFHNSVENQASTGVTILPATPVAETGSNNNKVEVVLHTTAQPDGFDCQILVPWIIAGFVLVILVLVILVILIAIRKTWYNGYQVGFFPLRVQLPPPGAEVRDMLAFLTPTVDPSWELFATQLNMDPGDIDSIRSERESCQLRLLDVLNRWRRDPPREYPFNMESVVAVLRTPLLGFHQLANDIENRNAAEQNGNNNPDAAEQNGNNNPDAAEQNGNNNIPDGLRQRGDRLDAL